MESVHGGTHDPRRNRLLAAFPEEEYNWLLPHLEFVELSIGQVLCESQRHIQYAYFPMTAIVSLVSVIESGATAEIALAGNDGFVGVSLLLGGDTTPSRSVSQSAGTACRVKGTILQEVFRRGGKVQRILLRYIQALLTQMAQTAVCNRHHTRDQQLCRWLLLSLDRLPTDQLSMTQELIANMLGVRREGVTQAAGKLQRAGLIEYHRGHIKVLDRQGLEARACECYRVVKNECDRLLEDIR